MECSPQARAWAVKYLKENNTEAFENLVDIFGEIIYNDPMIQWFNDSLTKKLTTGTLSSKCPKTSSKTPT
jgi:hypothetical protein